MGAFRDWWDENIYDPLYEITTTIGEGIRNWWYKNTGQAHLTPEYEHEEELAGSAYQRAALDMMAAGLSKFGGVNPASSPSPKSGQGLLATAMAAQQLRSQILSNKTDKWNLSKAKEWGVPTSAVGDFAKYDAVSKFLFGKGVHEIVGEDGLLGMLKGWFGNNDPTDPSPNTTTGGATDAVQAVESGYEAGNPLLVPVYSSIFGNSNVFKPAPFNFPKYLVTNEKGKFNVEPFTPAAMKEPNPQGAVKSAIDAANNFNRFDGYETSIGKEVNKFMIQTLNDDNMDSAHVERLARIIANMNGVSYESVLQLCYNWVEANLSGAEWVYHFDK